jgi:hypothetical protein
VRDQSRLAGKAFPSVIPIQADVRKSALAGKQFAVLHAFVPADAGARCHIVPYTCTVTPLLLICSSPMSALFTRCFVLMDRSLIDRRTRDSSLFPAGFVSGCCGFPKTVHTQSKASTEAAAFLGEGETGLGPKKSPRHLDQGPALALTSVLQ